MPPGRAASPPATWWEYRGFRSARVAPGFDSYAPAAESKRSCPPLGWTDVRGLLKDHPNRYGRAAGSGRRAG